jgi:hypothetical protein
MIGRNTDGADWLKFLGFGSLIIAEMSFKLSENQLRISKKCLYSGYISLNDLKMSAGNKWNQHICCQLNTVL